MAILNSCCCWRSLRCGSIVSGVYTLIYFVLNALQSGVFFFEKFNYWHDQSRTSLIDPKETYGAKFSMLIFCLSSFGIISTFLLFYGVLRNIKSLLIPWICNLAVFILTDFIYIINSLILRSLQWNPAVAFLITLDFFLNGLNLYALLCVTSQYQKYTTVQEQISTELNRNSTFCEESPKRRVKFKEPSNSDVLYTVLQYLPPLPPKESFISVTRAPLYFCSSTSCQEKLKMTIIFRAALLFLFIFHICSGICVNDKCQ
ncbi:hypothetical protein ABEB36_000835 [Hypothenemus hampei]|uniref:Uncharacterized protein n=1 Tax=Hypothenemus hampei TaxID=57062 RepID=A0ABD1FF79_HYPHA